MVTRFCVVGVAALALLVACGGEGDESGTKTSGNDEPPKAAESEAEEDELEEKPETWLARELERVEDTVDGIDFAVKLPEGVEREAKQADGTFPGYVTWSGKIAMTSPTFTAQVVTFPPADLEGAARELAMNKYEVVDKREDDGAFFVSVKEPSGKFMHSQVWRPAGENVVRFSVMHRTSEPMAKLDELIAWSQTIIESFEVR